MDTDDEIVEGTIVKIHLKHFVNYRRIDFFPSPRLNILVAPNGSGKSSLVSAIILALGGKPTIIGRSSDETDFIMSGESCAFVEVELYNPTGRNFIISRKIEKKNPVKKASSYWLINKKQSTLKEVETLMKRMNIQVDNLCQVLPQDRVHDFAKMNSVQLLENTQKTIGDTELFNKFVDLKNMREMFIEKKALMERRTKQFTTLSESIQRMEKNVQSILERKRVLESVTTCKQKLLWLKYNEKKEEQDKVNGYYKESLEKFNEFEKQLDPQKTKIRQLERSLSACHQNVRTKESEVNKALEIVQRSSTEAASCDRRITAIKNDLEERILKEERIKAQLPAMDAKINSYINEIGNFSESALTMELKNFDRDLSMTVNMVSESRVKEQQVKDELILCNNNLRALELRLEQARSSQKRKLDLLSKFPDVHSAYQWLQNNHHQISAPVHGPLFLEIITQDAEKAKYVEKVIPFRDIMAFIAESSEATTDLLRIRTKLKLKFNVASSEPPDCTVAEQYPPKLPFSQIKKYGFDCYLLDLVNGHPSVLSYLCKSFQFHNIPVAFRPIDISNVPKSIKFFFAGDSAYRVSVSKYSNQSSITSTKIKTANFLLPTTDRVLMNEINKQVVQQKQSVEECKRTLDEIFDMKHKAEVELNDLRNAKRETMSKLEEGRTYMVRLKKLRIERDQVASLSVNKQAEITTSQSKIREVVKQLVKVQEQLVKKLEIYHKAVIGLSLAEMNVEALSKASEIAKEILNQASENRNSLKMRCSQLQSSLSELKTELLALLKAAMDSTDGLKFGQPEFSVRFNRKFSKLPNAIDEIKAKISSFEARAKCLHNPEEEVLLKQYEENSESLKKIDAELNQLKNDIGTSSERAKDLQSSWLNQINKLIHSINITFGQFFQAMNCCGEVRLNMGDDQEAIEKFGLEILVKFRDDQSLRLLDGLTQSGGERALATAVFLLSLQKLSIAPFRCVDEINQGMDSFNERRVYNLLFNTIADAKSQYFLITPKLLDGIQYSSYSTVHNIINSGAVTCDEK